VRQVTAPQHRLPHGLARHQNGCRSEGQNMLKLITVHFMPSVRSVDERDVPRATRFVREMLTLTIGCVAAVAITLGLYLVAPTELRDGIVAAFYGFDMPTNPSVSTPHPHPPLP
jgi:hypothetical protein